MTTIKGHLLPKKGKQKAPERASGASF